MLNAVNPSFVRRKLSRKAAAWRVHEAFCAPESPAAYTRLSTERRRSVYRHVLYRKNKILNLRITLSFFQIC